MYGKDRELFDQLRDRRSQLASLSFIQKEELERQKSLMDEAERLEAKLASRSAPLRAISNLPSPAEIIGNLLNGMGRASAPREAMRSFRRTRPHPHDWAPFIALGSDDPLRGIQPSASGGSEE